MKTIKKFGFSIAVCIIFVLWASISYASEGGNTFSFITNGLSEYLLEAIAAAAVYVLYYFAKPVIEYFRELTGYSGEIKVKERIRTFVNSAKNRLRKSAKEGDWDEFTFENEVYVEVMRMITGKLPEYLNGAFSESWLKDLVTSVIEEENQKSKKE